MGQNEVAIHAYGFMTSCNLLKLVSCTGAGLENFTAIVAHLEVYGIVEKTSDVPIATVFAYNVVRKDIASLSAKVSYL